MAIQRKDTGAWAIPGGMVDPGEKVLFHSLSSHLSLSNSLYLKVSVTVKREFMEEALDSTGAAKVYFYWLIRTHLNGNRSRSHDSPQKL